MSPVVATISTSVRCCSYSVDAAPHQMVGLEPDSGTARDPFGDHRRDARWRDLDCRLDTRCCEFPVGLLVVAPIGEERELAGVDEDRTVRAGEASQPTDVDRLGNHEEGQTLVGHGRPHDGRTTPDVGSNQWRSGEGGRCRSIGHRAGSITRSSATRSTSVSSMTTGSMPLGPSSTNVTPSSAFLSRANRPMSSSWSAPARTDIDRS